MQSEQNGAILFSLPDPPLALDHSKMKHQMLHSNEILLRLGRVACTENF